MSLAEKEQAYSGTYWLRTYVTSQNFCSSKTQVSDDRSSKPSFYVFVFVLPYIKTDSVITNCSDQGLNILNGIKFCFESVKFEGMIISFFLVIAVILTPRKKHRFLFSGI
jgi:hypothetical protein